jgi:hypothetical protein
VDQLKIVASPQSQSAGKEEIKRRVLQMVELHICPVQRCYPVRARKRKEPLRVVALRKRYNDMQGSILFSVVSTFVV